MGVWWYSRDEAADDDILEKLKKSMGHKTKSRKCAAVFRPVMAQLKAFVEYLCSVSIAFGT